MSSDNALFEPLPGKIEYMDSQVHYLTRLQLDQEEICISREQCLSNALAVAYALAQTHKLPLSQGVFFPLERDGLGMTFGFPTKMGFYELMVRKVRS